MSLQPELDEPVPVVNDSGFYGGDGLSRHSSNSSGLHRDSCSSDIVTEGGLILGTLSVAPETSWVTMDTKIGNIFMVSCMYCSSTCTLHSKLYFNSTFDFAQSLLF